MHHSFRIKALYLWKKLYTIVIHDLQLIQFGNTFNCHLKLAWKSAEGANELCQLNILQKIVLKTNALYLMNLIFSQLSKFNFWCWDITLVLELIQNSSTSANPLDNLVLCIFFEVSYNSYWILEAKSLKICTQLQQQNCAYLTLNWAQVRRSRGNFTSKRRNSANLNLDPHYDNTGCPVFKRGVQN